MNTPAKRRIRIIPRLDIKGPNLIKGIHLEGLRVIGDPNSYAKRYYEQGADELIYMDIVASLYNRNNLTNIVQEAAREIFVPLTVGGGIRSVQDARKLLQVGADKIALNTGAIKNPELITQLAETFGSQCVVLSVEAKRRRNGGWEAFTDNGREHTELDVLDWVQKAERLGAGEILLTSVDQEGTRKGFDLELLAKVTALVNIPVIASGGMGNCEDFKLAVEKGLVDAVAMADVLHYNRETVQSIRDFALNSELDVRTV